MMVAATPSTCIWRFKEQGRKVRLAEDISGREAAEALRDSLIRLLGTALTLLDLEHCRTARITIERPHEQRPPDHFRYHPA
jgi:hypothetical protein